MKRKVYVAGHMLSIGSQMQRKKEKEMIEKMGHDLYNPMDNKEINDKTNAIQEGLAERIVRHDTDAIRWADTVLIEPLPEALGTNIELGQIKGMKDMAKSVLDIFEDNKCEDECDLNYILNQIFHLCTEVKKQEVIAHYGDIRRVPGITETGDRRSLGIHQYMYGVVLDVTNGKGFTEQSELEETLK